MTLDEALAERPIVAIIRGVKPEEAVGVAEALFEAGVRAVETPLNSPEPLESIRRIADAMKDRMAVGAGTVLSPEQVAEVEAAGGRFVVSPNTSAPVIAEAVRRGLDCAPGFLTPTEALAAIDAGARHLKLFPGVTGGPAHLKQVMAILPAGVTVWAVGGVAAADFELWWAAGARAFGMGSELYKPGMPASEVGARARAAVEAAALLA